MDDAVDGKLLTKIARIYDVTRLWHVEPVHIVFSHEAARDWEAKLTPALSTIRNISGRSRRELVAQAPEHHEGDESHGALSPSWNAAEPHPTRRIYLTLAGGCYIPPISAEQLRWPEL
jgi:hypothetical protein